MRSLRFVLAFALMSLSTAAFAQSDMHKSDAVQNSDAQKSFDQLKTLAGTWRGSVKATPPDPEIDNAKLEITLRVTSRGNALVHEMQEAGTPLDATKHDHPVTMLYALGCHKARPPGDYALPRWEQVESDPLLRRRQPSAHGRAAFG